MSLRTLDPPSTISSACLNLLPFLLINGPARKKMGIEHGGQLISRGANPAIGRALGLIIRNIAGYKLGRNYMGTFGYPLCFTLAENEEECPWDPYHVEHGFAQEDSTVTAGATVTWRDLCLASLP